MYRETNTTVNLEQASIFGIHQNKSTKAMDIMAYFHVNMSSEEMYEKMYLQKQLQIEKARCPNLSHFTDEHWADREKELKDIFRRNLNSPNSHGVPEAEVRETGNYFVRLNEIEQFINGEDETDGKKRTVLPEAREVIIQTLKLTNSQIRDSQQQNRSSRINR